MIKRVIRNGKEFNVLDKGIKIYATSLCKSYFYVDKDGNLYRESNLEQIKDIEIRRYKYYSGAVALLNDKAGYRFEYCVPKLKIETNVIRSI